MVKMFLLFCTDKQLSSNYINTQILDDYFKAGDWDIYSCFNRGNGYFENKRLYNEAVDKERNYIIWTNDETMLDYMQEDLFNGRDSNPDLFIQNLKYKKIKFFDVKKYSEDIKGKEIRSAHNIRKLILGGAFDIYKKGNK